VNGMSSGRTQELVRILMESPLYFELLLRERYDLIRHIGEISQYYGSGVEPGG
jgi:hypothetical protein